MAISKVSSRLGTRWGGRYWWWKPSAELSGAKFQHCVLLLHKGRWRQPWQNDTVSVSACQNLVESIDSVSKKGISAVIPALKLTWPLKMDGWKMYFLLGGPIFRGYVSFREGRHHVIIVSHWDHVVLCFFSAASKPWSLPHPYSCRFKDSLRSLVSVPLFQMARQLLLVCVAVSTVHGIDNGLGRTPPMGWRSWNLYGANVNQSVMQHIMDGMVSRKRQVNGVPTSLCDLGYCDVGLDDNWQDCKGGHQYSYHDDAGIPIINTDRFPDMVAMTSHAHQLLGHQQGC